MAKIGFSLHPVAVAIRSAEKKLRSLRPKVSKADQKKIDLNLRMLEQSYRLIRRPCPVKRTIAQVPFGQWFTSKAD
ncbi:MAG: hypothetical protein WAN14_18355 [Candidatus Acidiferrales bacterium]